MKFMIDRKWWGRGVADSGRLLDEESGRMCCLGFFARACGLPPTSIAGLGEPQEPLSYGFIGPVREEYSRVIEYEIDTEEFKDVVMRLVEHDQPNAIAPRAPEECVHFTSAKIAKHLMSANDCPNMSEDARERRVTELFASVGVDVEFVG